MGGKKNFLSLKTPTSHHRQNIKPCARVPGCPPGLRQLSVSELTETLEEVETAIRRYSEELIQALALRDELDYEKEVLGAAPENPGFILGFETWVDQPDNS